MLSKEEKIQLINAAIDGVGIALNRPIPRMTISERDELKSLVSVGRIDEAFNELSYKANAAMGRILEKTREQAHQAQKRNLDFLQEKLIKEQISEAKIRKEIAIRQLYSQTQTQSLDPKSNAKDEESKTNDPPIKNVSDKTAALYKKAREIGQEWMEAERKEGRNPGVTAIAKYVEGELSNRNITGAQGRFLDWQTIKREALKGITGRSPNGKHKKS